MNAIILCGGLSTRLGEITKDIPKILLPIGDKTVLDWQLLKLKAAGVKTVVLAAGHLSDTLQEAVGDERLGMNIIHAVEPTRLGTGGAIKFALNHIEDKDGRTFVLNGDVLTTIDFQDMASRFVEGSEGLLLGTHVKNAASLGTLVFDDTYKLIAFKEKEGKEEPAVINGGVYLFAPEVAQYFPEQERFSAEYDLFPKMQHVHVYESDKPWVDIGVPKRLKWARDNWERFKH